MLREELNQFLNELFAEHGIDPQSESAAQIRAIVYENDHSGRLTYWLDYVPGRNERDYCREVVATFIKMGAYVDLVRHNDDDTWADLGQQLRDWAYVEMTRRGFAYGAHTRELADNYAIQAIEDILQATFTFDTSYFAWLRLIVQRKCHQGARRLQTQKRGHNIQQVSLDEIVETIEQGQIPDPARAVEQRHDLQLALKQLTKARQEVIYLRHHKGLSPKETAKAMGRTLSSVYSLHFKALEQLKDILQLPSK